MRDQLSRSLLRIAIEDSNVIVLTGDHGYALFDDFRKHLPNQFVNAGIAEQNMVGVAAGLAKSGFRPIVYGLSAFVPMRVLEQIKVDVAHDNLPVIFLGDGAGLVYGQLGSSHQCCEDIAAINPIPNVRILSPADRFEMAAVMDFAYRSKGPAYVRIGKSDLGDVHKQDMSLRDESLFLLYENSCGGKYIDLISTGSMASIALDVASKLGESARVWSAPIVNGIREDELLEIARNSRFLVTIEEHSKAGGLGSIISSAIVKAHPTHLLSIGTRDEFSYVCGSHQFLLQKHGLDTASILESIRHFEFKNIT